jgi:hypothetical protein
MYPAIFMAADWYFGWKGALYFILLGAGVIYVIAMHAPKEDSSCDGTSSGGSESCPSSAAEAGLRRPTTFDWSERS